MTAPELAEKRVSRLFVNQLIPAPPDEKTYTAMAGKLPMGHVMPSAWYVGVYRDSGEHAGEGQYLHVPFARKKDADAARAALEKAGFVCEDSLRKAGIDEYERTMIEALQW